MAVNSGAFLHMTAQNDTGTLGGAGGGQRLNAVVVGTGTASAVLTLRVGNSSGPAIAIIDASAKGSYLFGGIVINGGIWAGLTGAAADVTIC